MNSHSRLRIPTGVVFGIVMLLGTGASVAANPDIEFDPYDFPAAPAINAINNQYWPLLEGTSFVYFAETDDGCEVNRVTIPNSPAKDDFAEPYDTIAARPVDDLAWFSAECDGDYVLMEKTTDWFAQDDSGNVWYLGEDTAAYDEEANCVSEEGAWQAGNDGAEAGIVMLGDPRVGIAYRQEYLEDEAEDMGKVLKLNALVELESPFGPFADCLVTKEWTPLERGAIEHKFYCPDSGPGLVLVEEFKGKTVRVEYVGTSLPAGTFPSDLPSAPACVE